MWVPRQPVACQQLRRRAKTTSQAAPPSHGSFVAVVREELVADGLGAKGLPDLRLGLALAFVFTAPLATLCIENIFSCPVWRALPSPAAAPVGRLVQAVALVLHTLGRIRLLPVAGSGPRGRVSIENIWLVGGLPLPWKTFRCSL